MPEVHFEFNHAKVANGCFAAVNNCEWTSQVGHKRTFSNALKLEAANQYL
jgi:hypothetical protein